MASEDFKALSPQQATNNPLKELADMKSGLANLRDELSVAQKKYDQCALEYEQKLGQVYDSVEQLRQEHGEREVNLLNATSEWLATKSKLEASAVSSKDKICLNVGGIYFETTIATLTKDNQSSSSYFRSLFSRQWQLDKDPADDSIFIDRDGTLFGHILQYFRAGQATVDSINELLRRNLLLEAEFYGIDSLIPLLTITNTISHPKREAKNLYSNSNILFPKDQQQLNKLFGNEHQQWQLIYRASRDGYTAQAFHKLCDDRCPTVTVIRSQNGYIFGGFTSTPWSSASVDKADAFAFLFTLKNPFGIVPTKYPVNTRATAFAVSHKISCGPTFGSVHNGGSDIFLHSPFNQAGSRTFFPRTYQDATGKAATTFTGDSHFYCDDLEIFTPV